MTVLLTLSRLCLFPLKQHHSPTFHSEEFQSFYSLIYTLGCLSLFYCLCHCHFSVSELFPTHSFCISLCSLAPLRVAGLCSSCFLYPAVCVQGYYRSHDSPKRYRTVSRHNSGISRLPEHLKLLKTSPAVMSNLHFCLNTH